MDNIMINLRNLSMVLWTSYGEPVSEDGQRAISAEGGDGPWWWYENDGWPDVHEVMNAVNFGLGRPAMAAVPHECRP